MDKSTLSAKLSAVIRAERMKKGFRSSHVAAQCSMSNAMYCEIELARKEITVSRLEQISKALGLKPSTLLMRANKLTFANGE